MERFDEEEIEEPGSPTGQYCNISAVSLYILGVLEVEVPLDEFPAKPLLQSLILPINPRFSSIMTVNDVLAGIVFFGIRLYMYKVDQKWSKTQSTALVVMNTRNIGGYNSVKEMLDTNSNGPWGNRFTFLHIPIPNLSDSKYVNPLEFTWEAHKEKARMKNSLAIPLNAFFLDMLRKLRGSEAATRHFHSTLRNSSLIISNMIGPVEKMAVANHPVKGIYFMVTGLHQSLTITITSYMGKLRIAFGAEKDFIDNKLFKSCLENSFEMICEAAKKI